MLENLKDIQKTGTNRDSTRKSCTEDVLKEEVLRKMEH